MSIKFKHTIANRINAAVVTVAKTKFKFRRVHASKKSLSTRLNAGRA